AFPPRRSSDLVVVLEEHRFVRSVFCPCLISVFVSLVWSHVCSHVLSSCFLVPAMCFPYVCLSMPCALLLLPVSPPLTCSQSPLCGHMFVPMYCPRASFHVLSICLFVYAMCPLVVVRVSTPHLFPISRFVCIIGCTCVLLIPLVYSN